METYEFTIDAASTDIGTRLDKYLTEQIPDQSRSYIQKLLDDNFITVNGKSAKSNYKLRASDTITVEIPEAEELDIEPENIPLDIVYEDDNFLVINKPYGYASIPSVNHDNTMANFVKHHFVSNNYPNQRVHIVTRLDKDTSGLMLFAKHGYAHARMDKQLQQKSIKKHYYALVEGETKLEQQGEIIAPIARDVDSIITRRVHKSGKYAHTSYRLVGDYGRVKLVDINLHTRQSIDQRQCIRTTGFCCLCDLCNIRNIWCQFHDDRLFCDLFDLSRQLFYMLCVLS